MTKKERKERDKQLIEMMATANLRATNNVVKELSQNTLIQDIIIDK